MRNPPHHEAAMSGCKCGERWRIIAFAVYSVAFEAIIWGIFGWAVFEKGHSGWWMVLATFIASCQLKPNSFGIRVSE